MESTFLGDDLQRRLYFSQFIEQQSTKPMSNSEQGQYDRRFFEMFAHQTWAESLVLSSREFTCDHAAQLIETLAPTLGKGYEWFNSVDPRTLSRLINEVSAFRDDYMTTHGEMPSDARIYREYRLQLEQLDVTDDYIYEATLLLEVLMGGDIKDGCLPEFSPSL